MSFLFALSEFAFERLSVLFVQCATDYCIAVVCRFSVISSGTSPVNLFVEIPPLSSRWMT